MRRSCAALLGLASAGCGSDLILLDPPPLIAGAQAAVIAVITDATTVSAHELKDGFPRSLILGRGVKKDLDVRIEVQVYTQSLGDLGLTAGELPVLASGPTTTLLPHGDDGEKLELLAQSGAKASWLKMAPGEVGPELKSFYIPRKGTPCVSFTPDPASLPSRFAAAFAIPVASDEALVGMHSDYQQPPELFLVGTSSVGRVQISPFERYFIAGAVLGVNDYLLLDTSESLSRGHFSDDTHHVLETSLLGGHLGDKLDFWLAAAPTHEIDAFVLNLDGSLRHFSEGTGFTLIDTLPMTDISGERPGGLLWIGPQEVLVAWPASQRILHYKEGVPVTETINSTHGFVGIADVPGIGPVASNANGDFFTRDSNGQWTMLADTPARLWPYMIHGFAEGFVFGEAFGTFGQYVRGYGFCATFRGSSNDIRFLVPIEDQIFLFGDNPNTPQTPFVRLKRL
ncbi:MAG: hypothetical protein U1E65_06670 [Myxococcota bacterium]